MYIFIIVKLVTDPLTDFEGSDLTDALDGLSYLCVTARTIGINAHKYLEYSHAVYVVKLLGTLKENIREQGRMRFKPLILFLLLSFVFINNSIAAKQCVILLHALARTTHSMSPIATCLEKANYIVVSQNYLTTKKSIKDLANEDVPSMVSQCQQYKPSKIHFVTHSLGGIVLREYLQGVHLPNLGRVVMLAPPNHGSQLADLLHRNLLFKLITGPAGQELTTSQSSTPNTLNQSVTYQLGIIAGNFSFNPFSKAIFHEDNDGKVSVSSARIKGMKDFIIVPVSHMFMTNSKLVQQEIVFFLQNGEFRRTT